jgi:hypothetical protein
LFFSLVLVESVLAVFFVVRPLLQMLKVRRKLTEQSAAQLLARQDAGLSDQLQTMLELLQHANSDLAQAGLDQKARALQSHPIEAYEQPQRSLKWAALLVFPLLAMAILALTGQWDGVTQAAFRVARYNEAFQKPLPYTLVLQEENLDVETGQRASFVVALSGSQLPEWVFLVMDGKEVALSNPMGADRYKHEFPAAAQPGSFYLQTPDGTWGPYHLNIRSKAVLKQARIRIIPPAYTGVPAFELSALRAMEFPEGSILQWQVTATDADSVALKTERLQAVFSSQGTNFALLQAGKPHWCCPMGKPNPLNCRSVSRSFPMKHPFGAAAPWTAIRCMAIPCAVGPQTTTALQNCTGWPPGPMAIPLRTARCSKA